MKDWPDEFAGSWAAELVAAPNLFWRDLPTTMYSRIGSSEEMGQRRLDFVESCILLQQHLGAMVTNVACVDKDDPLQE